MYISKPLFTLALCLASSQDVLGAPAQLDSRDIVERANPGNSENNPIKGAMNVDKQSRLRRPEHTMSSLSCNCVPRCQRPLMLSSMTNQALLPAVPEHTVWERALIFLGHHLDRWTGVRRLTISIVNL